MSKTHNATNNDDIVDNLVTQIQANELRKCKVKLNYLDALTPKKRRKPNPPKNYEFFEVTIPSMTLDDFRHHFRMTRSCCEDIMTRVGNRIRVFNIQKKFLFTVWMLTTRESFGAVGTRFGLSKGPSHQYFRDIMDGLIVLFKEYVAWPSVVELSHIEQGFKPKSGGYVPGIVGAIDSCHLLIKKPSRYSIYCNPKQTHSIILQGVCDHQKIFTDIYVGAPGCLTPERVYNNSPLSKLIKELIPEDYHIVGNIFIPQKQNLIVPFPDQDTLNQPQKVFNECLAAANMTILQAFQLLLARFRRLTFLDTANPEMANKMICSCVILHNHILMHDLDENPEEFLNEWPELYMNEDPSGVIASDDDADGLAKRDYLVSLLEFI
ncbi:putative nuclease HARBI1 [Eupeodes corollae]|uniref:putative nuclease HARBI1 n=1 Tax=Eupeodes corollae TaxID=290404 RepID=UPI002493CE71|nr:putative nuclease HARBI1 [Eupeodes corollae]